MMRSSTIGSVSGVLLACWCTAAAPGQELVNELAPVSVASLEPLRSGARFSFEQPDAGSVDDTAPSGEAGAADLAKKLSNPIASLISVPLQLNFDQNLGLRDDGERYLLNVQPVVPISLNEEWNLITRTIVPLIYQDDIAPGAGDQFGLGDISLSLFFSPKKPTSNGVIWGAGPVFLLPTATDELLGSEKLGVGPTIVALKQSKGWTYGALANHIWSVAGEDSRADVNSTFVQPFLSYTTPKAWTFALNTETAFNWTTDRWSVPVNMNASKLFRIGSQAIQIGGGARYWAESTPGGPEGLGFRVFVTLLFPL